MHIPRVSFRGLYLATLFGWLALSLLSLGVVVVQSKSSVDQEFERHATASFHELRTKLRANEAAINSFASFLGAVNVADRDSVAVFAATMKANYPHIYMFEVVRKVARHERWAFESYMRASFDPEFRIRNFSYDSNRQWASVRDKAVYFPLIFMWPEVPAARAVFGLDMDSVPHLQQAALAADASDQTAITKPFRLVEGSLAYAMFRQAMENKLHFNSRINAFSGALQALLIIRAEDLIPSQLQAEISYRITINDSGQTNHPLLLEVASTAEKQPGADYWLPKVVLSFEDESPVQPLKLTMERQMRWSDISSPGLVGVALLSSITLLLLLGYLRHHHRRLIDSDFHATQTQFLALHDALTALPNRLLFKDRLKFLLGNWRRRSESFGLMFIDLDLFKEVNDCFGHKVGDLLLIEVARRLRSCVRETDTVARIGGDEFVALIGQVSSHEHLLSMAQQMLAHISEPIVLEGHRVAISASIGISACPEDGIDAEVLIHRADMAMYVVKQSGRNGVMGLNRSPAASEHSSEVHLQLVK